MPDGGFFRRTAPDREQRLVLLRRQSDFNGPFLAERLEAANGVAKRGQRRIVGISQQFILLPQMILTG